MRCTICRQETDRKVEHNFMKIWKEYHEWTDLPMEGIACKDCIGWIKKELFAKSPQYNDPMPHITGPEPWDDDAKGTVIAIFDSKIIGLRCAKIKYGIDAVAEIIRGYYYEDERGDHIVRITVNDVPETTQCSNCRWSLWACNASEVTI